MSKASLSDADSVQPVTFCYGLPSQRAGQSHESLCDFLLPLQGGGREGDGSEDEGFLLPVLPHPHPSPPLEGEGVGIHAIALSLQASLMGFAALLL